MELDRNDLEQHLWETFLIDSYKQYRKEIINAPDDNTREKFYKNLVLNHFFLLRYIRDHGFYEYVKNEIFQDDDLQNIIIKIIKNLFDTHVFPIGDEFMGFQSDKCGKKRVDYRDNIANDQQTTLFLPGKIEDKTLKYLKKRYKKSLDNKDDDEIVAISVLINKFTSGFVFFDHQLFNEFNICSGIFPTNKWTYKTKEFILKNIKFSDIYSESHINCEPDFFENNLGILDNTEFYKKTLNILDEYGDISSFGKYNMWYFPDCIRIGALLWFNNREISDKLDILNQLYPIEFKKTLSLNEIASYNIVTDYLETVGKGNSMALSFQFNCALDCFEKAHSLEKILNRFEIKTLLRIANIYIFLNDLDKARYYLEKINEFDKDIINVHILLGTINIKENRFSDGIKEIEQSLQIAHLVKEDGGFVKVFHLTIEYLIKFDCQNLILNVLEKLETKLSNLDVNISSYNEIGCAFEELGLNNDALYYYKQGLLKEDNKRIRAILFLNMGLVYKKLDLLNESIEMYEKSIKLGNNEAWYYLSQTYINKFNFIESCECIKNAINYFPNEEKLKQILQIYENLASEIINLDNITDVGVKSKLKIADDTLRYEIIKKDDSDITNIALAFKKYNDALEEMLHIHIASIGIENIYEKFGPNCKSHKLPYGLYVLIKKERKISPGTWIGFIDELNKYITDPFLKIFTDSIKFDKNELRIIQQACKSINEIRDYAVHEEDKIGTMEWDEIIDKRKTIIKKFNEAIQIIYS